MRKEFPFELTNGFLAIPNEVRKFYVKHPKIKPIHILVYGALLDYYSALEGYAYPTQDRLAADLCVSKPTVQTALETLEEVRLIRAEKHPYFGNNVYYFEEPARSIEEFFARFPEAREYAEQDEEKRERRRRENAEYKRKWEERRRENESKKF
jgi:DNA-binding MarR family transcriptional regulator